MIGELFRMEFKTNWKTMAGYLIVMILVAGGFTQAYTVLEGFNMEDLQGQEFINATVPDTVGAGTVNITWDAVPGASVYLIIEDNTTNMLDPTRIYITNSTEVFLPYDYNDTHYYAIMAMNTSSLTDSLGLGGEINLSKLQESFNSLTDNEKLIATILTDPESLTMAQVLELVGNDMGLVHNATGNYTMMEIDQNSSTLVLVGMASSSMNVTNIFDELLEEDFYQAFIGETPISFNDIKGFVSMEFHGMIIIWVGFFLAYFSASSISEDYDGKRLDMAFSNPISRDQYILEKFAAQVVLSVGIVVISAISIAASAASIGQGDGFPLDLAFASIIGALPLFLSIQAAGFFGAVYLKSGKKAMGFSFMFAAMAFAFKTVAGLSESLKWMDNLSILKYWDYNAVLLEQGFGWGNFVVLSVLTIVLLAGTIYVFREQDIPA